MTTARRRRGAVLTVALTFVAVASSACSDRSQVLDVSLAPLATTTTSSTVVRTTTTRNRTASTAARAATATTTAETCPVAASRPVDPTLPSGGVATSSGVGARFSHPKDWPVTDVAVAARELMGPGLLQALGLGAGDSLRPLATRSRANFPGIAVLRLPRPASLTITETATELRDFYVGRRFAVDPTPLSICLDGARAIGMISSNGEILQATWIAYRGTAMYLVLGLALDERDVRSQAAMLSTFNQILGTFRFTS